MAILSILHIKKQYENLTKLWRNKKKKKLTHQLNKKKPTQQSNSTQPKSFD